ncbi:hypothetical protein A5792_03740 [Mycolicibacterium peregrinum]|uniref:PE-PPE domain-containing protein n=1 Tax=Mycolicibacterium peregrinum TaxID=43304 RepID=A0A1A0QWD6_MYCPR|nr:hypothetical protein [Mycolicibacterium peregrinum]OBB26228.1 hypothetical protein A5792_03740 [Mycolicibacterium peregrinum]
MLALGLGIGAVVAGSAGIANAEGSPGNNAGSVAHSSDSPAGAGTVKRPPSVGSPGAKTRKPGLSSTPRITAANSRRAPIGDEQAGGAGPAPIPGLSVRISRKTPAPLSSGAPARPTGVSTPSTSVRPHATRIRSRLATAPTAGPVPSGSPATVLSVDLPSAANTGGAPTVPMPMVQAVLQLVHREVERFALGANHFGPAASTTPIGVNAVPAIAPGVPTPVDQVPTAYGDIGKWMLQSNGQISNYGGLPYQGRTVLEPVNVIIVDPTSTSAAEAACKLNTVMFWSGYPAQPIHSTGFQGTIDDVTYGQQPTGPLLGYSDNFFLFPNNHGRIFGPDPVETSAGYVWSGSFSTEQFVIYDLLPRHAYVSSNLARNALALRLLASGRATYGGMVALDNSYNTATTTTGDHDGYAVVIVLK